MYEKMLLGKKVCMRNARMNEPRVKVINGQLSGNPMRTQPAQIKTRGTKAINHLFCKKMLSLLHSHRYTYSLSRSPSFPLFQRALLSLSHARQARTQGVRLEHRQHGLMLRLVGRRHSDVELYRKGLKVPR
jgi:hypothetical protein